ncbi:MAG: transposase [Arthrobacter sp.]
MHPAAVRLLLKAGSPAGQGPSAARGQSADNLHYVKLVLEGVPAGPLEMSRDPRPVYTAPSGAAAKERFVDFSTKWGRQYPAITRLWKNAWSEFVLFLDYDVVIAAICDIFSCPSEDLITVTAADVRTRKTGTGNSRS